MKCPFCSPKRENLLYEDELIRVILDEYPANRGHVLVVPRRHIEAWEELDEKEKIALMQGVDLSMKALKQTLNPDGFNVGINLGEAAGQTVSHIHIHVIPRWKGDCNRPRGGVRKAVLDIEDENLTMKERWEKNRLGREEVESLRKAFLSLLGEGT
ncbi:probable bis(5'-adenosyl)-triphosphatase, HIT family [Thermococcus kodakarensis KOD1]|uniref:Probable bis(5'-adenosyl)-triphosphatase, HIT family n=1 Tax=Thermococcus kodakarensis (strain ATCC BAA-918 / JCM 12380 / KOD1) TaxID=69014 RepID=Q5JIU7_THEKO|nr:HIT family protein [Thermococcus kodakarensis]WCN27571.1 HIT family protein [Thermococcus kodakarensis]WCN29862.1 HIT family protein [Thermococcus kodakarensis]BAD85828.1 probable bis(5'-adenosyl)-triphosphatase, HIT family [Thermococcus kodakarensis KOD1]